MKVRATYGAQLAPSLAMIPSFLREKMRNHKRIPLRRTILVMEKKVKMERKKMRKMMVDS